MFALSSHTDEILKSSIFKSQNKASRRFSIKCLIAEIKSIYIGELIIHSTEVDCINCSYICDRNYCQNESFHKWVKSSFLCIKKMKFSTFQFWPIVDLLINNPQLDLLRKERKKKSDHPESNQEPVDVYNYCNYIQFYYSQPLCQLSYSRRKYK